MKAVSTPYYLHSEDAAVVGFIRSYNKEAAKNFTKTELKTTTAFSIVIQGHIVSQLNQYSETQQSYKNAQMNKLVLCGVVAIVAGIVAVGSTALAVELASAFFAAIAVVSFCGLAYTGYRAHTIDSDPELTGMKERLEALQKNINNLASNFHSDLAKLYALRVKLGVSENTTEQQTYRYPEILLIAGRTFDSIVSDTPENLRRDMPQAS